LRLLPCGCRSSTAETFRTVCVEGARGPNCRLSGSACAPTASLTPTPLELLLERAAFPVRRLRDAAFSWLGQARLAFVGQ
jgi:hypothetical protein